MTVAIPTPLQSYTGDAARVGVRGTTVREMLADLERGYPGIRFRMIDEQDRIRQHIRIFVNGELAEALDTAVGEDDDLRIICAISGG